MREDWLLLDFHGGHRDGERHEIDPADPTMDGYRIGLTSTGKLAMIWRGWYES